MVRIWLLEVIFYVNYRVIFSGCPGQWKLTPVKDGTMNSKKNKKINTAWNAHQHFHTEEESGTLFIKQIFYQSQLNALNITNTQTQIKIRELKWKLATGAWAIKQKGWRETSWDAILIYSGREFFYLFIYLFGGGGGRGIINKVSPDFVLIRGMTRRLLEDIRARNTGAHSAILFLFSFLVLVRFQFFFTVRA